MDLLQSAIRTLYYDVNIDRVFQEVGQSCCTFLNCDFASLSAWTTQTFTRSELSLLQSYVLQNTTGTKSPKWHHAILLLNRFTKDCLKEGNPGQPIVCFEKLQYWRELSLLLGEDLFTTSFLAEKQVNRFNWPNIIEHDETQINVVLQGKLCDVHAHLKASADIFELTWLDFMNRVINRDEDYKGVQYLADIHLISKRDEKNCSFRKMVQIAGMLRMFLFEFVQGKSDLQNIKIIKRAIDDDIFRTHWLPELQSKISLHKKLNQAIFDYACTTTLTSDVFSIHQGERELLYKFFRGYYSKQQNYEKYADFFFLYISLKIRIRKEFVQTNPLYGFENFKLYESRKTRYCDAYKDVYSLYAVQTTIRPNSSNQMEARVMPNGIPTGRMDLALDKKTYLREINPNSLSFVIHFIKKNERKVHRKTFGMRYDFKDVYKSEIQNILTDWNKRSLVKYPSQPVYRIVGIDVAGEEIECPPAVFGHVYRYARKCGLDNQTYHVGEDFYDIADGLKNIDDAIRFLELKEGCRLGHVLALGLSPHAYYKNRGYQVVMSKQRLLDILVWIISTCKRLGIPLSSDFESKLNEKVHSLYSTIGYAGNYVESDYFESMLLRSDDEVGVEKSRWDNTSLCGDILCSQARSNNNARRLCVQFMTNKAIWEKGNSVDLFCYPQEVSDIIEKLQNYLMAVIVKKKIAIETNPSSNVKIGPIDGYIDHPIFRFMANGINVSINTDDKGIFATSLSNEYSLIANAYCQRGHTIAEAALMIERLKYQAKEQIFKPKV